jgi:membrane protein required for colicin V production
VREALSIVAWVGAAVVTLYLFNWGFAQAEQYVHNPLLSQVIAGFGLFVTSLIILTILTGLVARMVHVAGLTPIDRTLGFIFGLARGVFLVSLAYLLLDLSLPQQNDRPPWIREAKSSPYLHEGAEVLRGFLPETLKVRSADAIDDVKKLSPTLDAAREAQRAMGALSKPTPAPTQPPTPGTPAQPAPASGNAAQQQQPKAEAAIPPPSYKPSDQKQLDRLIGTQR